MVLPGIGECEILLGTRNKEQIAAFYHSHGVKIVVIKDGKMVPLYQVRMEKAPHR